MIHCTEEEATCPSSIRSVLCPLSSRSVVIIRNITLPVRRGENRGEKRGDAVNGVGRARERGFITSGRKNGRWTGTRKSAGKMKVMPMKGPRPHLKSHFGGDCGLDLMHCISHSRGIMMAIYEYLAVQSDRPHRHLFIRYPFHRPQLFCLSLSTLRMISDLSCVPSVPPSVLRSPLV